MAKGLSLARVFALYGHRVIGADSRAPISLVLAVALRLSSGFYILFKPDPKGLAAVYIRHFVKIVEVGSIDLCVSSSRTASVMEDAHASS